jgi:YfiH family protein
VAATTTTSTSPSSSADHGIGREAAALIERRLGPARAVWTDRHAGDLRGDAAARERLAAALGLGPPSGWWWLHEVHGARVEVATGPPPATPPDADALVTTVAGLPLVVQIGDCAPIAIASDTAVGAVHAGWPGLLAGVIEAAVERLRTIGEGPVRAVLGPCIHPERYEFGAEELERLVARFGPSVASTTAEGAPAFDVPEAVRCALAGVGVDDVEDLGICTSASPDYFSHRRDGDPGRQALVVVRT